MPDRPTERFATGHRRRPSTRLRASLESLDRRQLLAASVTGVAIPITGNVASPLRVQQSALGSIGALPYQAPDAPIGTPIPLVTLTSSDATATLSAADYTGTVDWGDGTSTDAARFGTFTLPSYEVVPPNALIVNGPEHTYATPGTYTITVSVTGQGITGALVITDTATISTAPALDGQLSRASDSGYLDTDNITAIKTPTYFGTTEPGATVALAAVNTATGQALTLGSAVADALGNWSIVSSPVADGVYAFSATAISTFGGTTTVSFAGVPDYPSDLTIDTAGPQITGFRVINARTGKFQVDFADQAGLFLPSLTQSTAYQVGRPSPAPKKGHTFAVSTLTVSNALISSTNPILIYPTATVTGTVGTGKTLISRNGTYRFTIDAAGISGVSGVSGASLAGEFTGRFPTAGDSTGDNFQIQVNVRNGKVAGLARVTPARVTAHTVKVRAVVEHHV